MGMMKITGQEPAIRRLELARQMGRLPHGFIFSGPEGVGKASLAREWAKLMLCPKPVVRRVDPAIFGCETVLDGCDQCQDCHLVDSQTHPDIHFIDRDLGRFTSDSNRSKQLMTLPVDVIREFVIEPAGWYPTRGRSKVFIIDEAQTMAAAAQNALLKTLEEPPDGTYLILITSRPDLLLKTIHSRSQQVRFRSLPTRFVMEKLQENEISGTQAAFWADFSTGRLGVALTLAQLDFYARMMELLSGLYDLGYPTLLTLSASLVEAGKEFSAAWTKQNPKHSGSDATRTGFALFLQLYSWAFQKAIHIHSGTNPAGLSWDTPLERLCQTYGPSACARAIQATARAEGALTTNVNHSLLFEALLLDYIEMQTGR